MILLPDFTKKHAAALLIGVAAVATTAAVYHHKSGAGGNEGAHPEAITVEGYAVAARAALGASPLDDAEAASSCLEKLLALSVPAEAMPAHFALVSALTSYRQAIAAGRDRDAAAAKERVKSVVAGNSLFNAVVIE